MTLLLRCDQPYSLVKNYVLSGEAYKIWTWRCFRWLTFFIFNMAVVIPHSPLGDPVIYYTLPNSAWNPYKTNCSRRFCFALFLQSPLMLVFSICCCCSCCYHLKYFSLLFCWHQKQKIVLNEFSLDRCQRMEMSVVAFRIYFFRLFSYQPLSVFEGRPFRLAEVGCCPYKIMGILEYLREGSFRTEI